MSRLAGWQLFLAVNGVLAAVSVPLYIIVPSGTSAMFHPRGDRIAADQRWWVQTVAAGDALVAAVALFGVQYGHRDAIIRRFCLASTAMYNFLHMSAFAAGKFVHGDILGVAKFLTAALFPVAVFLVVEAEA
jgi:hypothetical protein